MAASFFEGVRGWVYRSNVAENKTVVSIFTQIPVLPSQHFLCSYKIIFHNILKTKFPLHGYLK